MTTQTFDGETGTGQTVAIPLAPLGYYFVKQDYAKKLGEKNTLESLPVFVYYVSRYLYLASMA
ncbi:hypothetical protein BH10BAC3_BH10BAC3_11220 [soil metagenome]